METSKTKVKNENKELKIKAEETTGKSTNKELEKKSDQQVKHDQGTCCGCGGG